MPTILEALTLASATSVVYHHAGYPVLLNLLTRSARATPPAARDNGRNPASPISGRGLHAGAAKDILPSITILVPAYQEAAVIADKIRNLAAQYYPAALLDVVVACDGCTDGTAALARAAAAEPECAHLAVTVLDIPRNQGKVAVLNETLPRCRGEIVALTDASALLSVDALLLATSHFAKHDVGVVCATYRILTPGSTGEAAYWDYQIRIKERESQLGGPLGAHGAFYLVRRSLFRPLPTDTINDDFILPLSIVGEGHRAVYDPDMMALELECADLAQDQRRRRRIAAGNLQQIIRLRRLLNPRRGGIAFTFLSGKALRVAMPFLMTATLAGSAWLALDSFFWAAATALQLATYVLAVLRQALPGVPWPAAVDKIHYFAAGHTAGMIGATRYVLGLERGRWHRAGL